MTFTAFEYLLTFLSLLVSFSLAPLLIIYPLKSHLNTKPRTVWIIHLVPIGLSVVILLLFPDISTDRINSMILILLFLGIIVIPSFFLLKDCTSQVLYSVCTCLGFGTVSVGISNYLEAIKYRPFFMIPLLRVILTLLLCMVFFCVFLPLFTLWTGKSKRIWRMVWLIPLFHIILALISGNVWFIEHEESGLSFIGARLFLLISLLACTSLLTQILQQKEHYAAIKSESKMLSIYQLRQERTLMELSHTTAETRAAHDTLTETLTQIKSLAEVGDFDAISGLLSRWSEDPPISKPLSLCQNQVVNALLSWYHELAKKEQISLSLHLYIPERPGVIRNVDLCRIVGNMLENALEACLRMRHGKREIIFSAMVSGNTLVLVMDNSFDGDVFIHDGRYLSQKRESRIATGISSIETIAEEYQGRAVFKADGNVFRSSVRLYMGEDSGNSWL